MPFVPAGLADPTTGTTTRRLGSIRRTSHIDMLPRGSGFGGRLDLSGRARDLWTDPSGLAEIVDTADVQAELDERRVLHTLRTTPRSEAADALVGLPVAAGFRAEVDRLFASETTGRSPLYLLLDDMPVAALISGYAVLYRSDETALPADAGAMSRAMVKADICSGWRNDGAMMVALRETNRLPAPVGPAAPALERPDDPLSWHDVSPLESGAMRRRRLVDVTWSDPLTVTAMFRDTHRSVEGAETVLHEYTLDATVDPETMRILTCVATPRSLPWSECPEAAASARRLEGRPIEDLRRSVRAELRGTSTCTHLNDLLRSLADVSSLATVLRARLGRPHQ